MFTSWDQSLGRICLEREKEKISVEPGGKEKGDHIPCKLPMCSLILVCSLGSSHASYQYIVFWFQMDPARHNLFIRDLLGICCTLHTVRAQWGKRG